MNIIQTKISKITHENDKIKHIIEYFQAFVSNQKIRKLILVIRLALKLNHIQKQKIITWSK
jgi:hypothetical protein